MDILIRDADEKREKLLVEISELEKEIHVPNLSEAITKNCGILREVLQGHQEYVREKKMCKLKKDATDYATGRVFTYSPKFDNINLERRGWDGTDTCFSGLKPASRFVPVLPTDSAFDLIYNQHKPVRYWKRVTSSDTLPLDLSWSRYDL
ncbi:hypothetical protein NDU88_002854 [Pleurodeles waltl]|uniref:Uncharacterized protein n=1 Tax=Pleurodeles waltl TaxID=8319 RepID=A0AAV7W1T2_PLEWA|nr:hypothetical protein NDU88_002854 [Pleurodeles waltl]